MCERRQLCDFWLFATRFLALNENIAWGKFVFFVFFFTLTCLFLMWRNTEKNNCEKNTEPKGSKQLLGRWRLRHKVKLISQNKWNFLCYLSWCLSRVLSPSHWAWIKSSPSQALCRLETQLHNKENCWNPHVCSPHFIWPSDAYDSDIQNGTSMMTIMATS